jgi:predicted aldo/keto reductase-like oxidoreductase
MLRFDGLFGGKRVKHRKFGKLDWSVSALGFGAMRLPTIDGDPAKIDEPLATEMIRYAIDHGVNYVDTAHPYHGGTSEKFLAKVLQNGYRQKVKLATKMPTWYINTQQDMDKIFNEQLARLKMDYVDFYLLHGIGLDRWKKLQKLNVTDWLENKVKQGKIRYLGFSFHDEYQAFKQIIDDYNGWTMCQIQYNYMDADYQAGTKGLKYAHKKGLATVIMEPVAGGRLALNPPKPIQTLWNKATTKRTQAEWALRWVWNHPEVTLVLSGMSTLEQVKENVKTANHSQPPTLNTQELALIGKVAKKYRQLGFAACTKCRYCQPCQQGVQIPEIIELYNQYYANDRNPQIKTQYKKQIPPEHRAKNCIKCGKCEELCPQKLPIRQILGNAAFVIEQEN